MNVSDFKRDDWIVVGLGLLLAIDLIALPWFSFSFAVLGFKASESLAATSAPDGWAGILAFLLALLVVIDLVIERVSPQTSLPNIGGSRTTTRLALALGAALFLAVKFVTNIHFSYFGFGFWAAVVLTAALVFATRKLSQDQSVLPVR